MRERFKQWQLKRRINKWRMIGAVATPVLIGMVWWLWLLPDRRLQPDGGRLSHNERALLAHLHRETLIGGMGTIVMVAGGVFLLLNFRMANRNTETAELSGADLINADLNCTLLSDANLSDANLSGALLFFVNSREVQNLEPLQLEAKPSPFLCHVALPSYSYQPEVNPNRDCDRLPQLLSARYNISLEEAQGIVNKARQHRWD